MKNLFILLVLLAIACAGCGGDFGPASNANGNTKPPPTILPTGMPTPPTTNSNTKATPPPNATPQPTPISGEKKDEGLFSFPPPQAVSVARLDNAKLMNREGPTNFGHVSEKLINGLQAAGYSSDHYSYFWNSADEFAIVTGLERVREDGSVIESDNRWNTSKQLPRARGISQYFRYLISGKKVYYRVFAFIVTRRNYNFKGNTPPSFEMASDWMNKGLPVFGDQDDPGSVQYSEYTDKYHCFALLYLFVNHTSLDGPLAVNSLPDNEAFLLTRLNKGAESHLAASNIVFGE